MEKRQPSTQLLVLTGAMTAVTAALSQVSIPLPSGVPVTMQTFAVALSAYLLGSRLGAASVAIYILLGIIGIPVFANFRGGPAVILGMTGGYIWGFLLMAALCGFASSRKSPFQLVSFSLLGLACCHIPGMFQFALLTGRTVPEAFLLASAPYLAKDLVSMAAAYFAARMIRVALLSAGLLGYEL